MVGTKPLITSQNEEWFEALREICDASQRNRIKINLKEISDYISRFNAPKELNGDWFAFLSYTVINPNPRAMPKITNREVWFRDPSWIKEKTHTKNYITKDELSEGRLGIISIRGGTLHYPLDSFMASYLEPLS